MAGGIDWFRFHHGTVSDQKWPLIAKRSGGSVAEVIAVWACLMESASMNERERGVLDALPDFEALDCALGMPDGRFEAIFSALQQRGLLDNQLQLTAWPRRQPKRERADDNSTERSRLHRAKKRAATPSDAASDADGDNPGQATPGNDSATPGDGVAAQRNASNNTGTPRGEERREEEKDKGERASSDPPFARARVHEGTVPEQAAQAMQEAGFEGVVPEDPDLLAVLAQGITVGELKAAAQVAKGRKKGENWAYARAVGKRADAAQQQAAAPAAPTTVAASETTAEYLQRMAAEDEAQRNRPKTTVDVAAIAAAARKRQADKAVKGPGE